MNNASVSKTILLFSVLALFALSTACGGGSSSDEAAAPESAKYTVTYSGNGNTGGSVPADTAGYEQGQSVTVLGNTNNLIKSGYTFIGWCLQANGAGTSYTPGQIFIMGAADITLYAKWTANPTWTVTYAGNGNTGGSVPVDTAAYEQDTSVTVLGNIKNLIRTGYTFTGWSTQANGAGTSYTPGQIFIMGAANVTLYAKWSANPTWTVTYAGNGNTGGSVPVDTTGYEQGQSVTVLGNTGNLARTGYTFTGWCIQANGSGTSYTPGQIFIMGTANVTLYAKWDSNPTWTVTYAGNGNTGGSVPVDTTGYEQGKSVTVKGNTGGLARTGYTFTGWNTLANGSGTSYTPGQIFIMGTANVTLYAKWAANPTYTVTYAGNGNSSGSVPVDTTAYEQGASVTVPGNTGGLARTGYTFTGWNTLASGSGTSYTQGQIFTMGTSNVTLYAKWAANPTWTVTYSGNGNTSGSVPVDTTAYEQSASVTVLGNTGSLTRTGYTFTGWNTLVNGSGTSYTQGQIFMMGTSNVTLYAKWNANPISSNLIIDHTCTSLSSIPDEWIKNAKSSLHIAYQHTSHGSQLVTGMYSLPGFKGSLYSYNEGGTGGALDLRDEAIAGGYDLGNPDRTAWASKTREYLNTHAQVNVIMWAWCGEVSYATEADINTYLSLMSQLEADYPDVKFVYMTGHTDGTGLSGTLFIRNKQIRDYCTINNKILYDFADIESYDPDGNYYGDKHVTGGCNYDYDNDGTTSQSSDEPPLPTGGDRNWALDWQKSHTEGIEWYYCGSAHSQPLNANQKAYAVWWLFARLAGWDGE